MDPLGSISAVSEQKIDKVQKQLALRGDVQLMVHALLVILHRVNAELEPLGNLGRWIAEKHQANDVTLSRRQLVLQESIDGDFIIDGRKSAFDARGFDAIDRPGLPAAWPRIQTHLMQLVQAVEHR